ncbi:DUF2946 family protein [Paracoccus zhejiangensis]|uniref:Cobalt transporter n=1 Tax=Paracoccus zhejiangensis TaxID=1077935 RepID=A0A2H5F372_9RHOB|nr:hypothetical protein [Paracoccus zhejiangensis]AUH65994.1 hypothetical protein CX676_19035 [Paracoccus zhejiangensis]
MRRWICSLLVVLIALGGVLSHGQVAEAGHAPGHHAVAIATDASHAEGHQHGKSHDTGAETLSDACAILCLGTPAPWGALAEQAPTEAGRSLKWRFTALSHEGLRVGPGYRPPTSI